MPFFFLSSLSILLLHFLYYFLSLPSSSLPSIHHSCCFCFHLNFLHDFLPFHFHHFSSFSTFVVFVFISFSFIIFFSSILLTSLHPSFSSLPFSSFLFIHRFYFSFLHYSLPSHFPNFPFIHQSLLVFAFTSIFFFIFFPFHLLNFSSSITLVSFLLTSRFPFFASNLTSLSFSSIHT